MRKNQEYLFTLIKIKMITTITTQQCKTNIVTSKNTKFHIC